MICIVACIINCKYDHKTISYFVDKSAKKVPQMKYLLNFYVTSFNVVMQGRGHGPLVIL